MSREQGALLGCDVSNRLILDQIADKWSIFVLGALCEQPLRFNEIRRQLEGVTQKALTQCLRRLERNGIIDRRVLPGSPVAVQYSVTPLGVTLKEPFQALNRWTIDHMADVHRAQIQFDARCSGEAV